jgi:adenosylcobinamide kinase/adenosylcobinamide-phosphate guanylyltransferase
VIAHADAHTLVVDCLTLWLSNIMFANKNCDDKIDALLSVSQSTPKTIIFVTNEVGSGIVPTDNALSREFRDRAGILNQRIAAIATEVYWMVFGLPMRVK